MAPNFLESEILIWRKMRLRLFLWLTVRNCHCPDSEDVIETFEKTLFSSRGQRWFSEFLFQNSSVVLSNVLGFNFWTLYHNINLSWPTLKTPHSNQSFRKRPECAFKLLNVWKFNILSNSIRIFIRKIDTISSLSDVFCPFLIANNNILLLQLLRKTSIKIEKRSQ